MRITLILLASLLLSTSSFAIERHYLLKLSGYDGSKSLQVMSQDELKEFEKQLRLESRLISKANRAAKTEWDASRSKGDMPYSSFKARRFSKGGTYKTRAEADKKLAELNEREAKKAAEEQKSKKSPSGRNISPAEKAAMAEKEDRKKSQEKKAYDLFIGHLTEMIEAAGGKAPVLAAASATPTPMKPSDTKKGEFEATIIGTLKASGDKLYVAADEGQTIKGMKPWAIGIPRVNIAAKMVTQDMVGKKVKIHFIGFGGGKNGQIKVKTLEIKNFEVLDAEE